MIAQAKLMGGTVREEQLLKTTIELSNAEMVLLLLVSNAKTVALLMVMDVTLIDRLKLDGLESII